MSHANGGINPPKRSSRMASYSDCPICGKSFPISKILQHADACARKIECMQGDKLQNVNIERGNLFLFYIAPRAAPRSAPKTSKKPSGASHSATVSRSKAKAKAKPTVKVVCVAISCRTCKEKATAYVKLFGVIVSIPLFFFVCVCV